MPVEKVSRREQILAAAFKTAYETEKWSMSDLADQLGVSKTALYRHFKSRAEIEEAMNSQFEDNLASIFESAPPTPSGIRNALASFFRENSGHLFLFMHNMFSVPCYPIQLFNHIRSQSPRIEAFARLYAESSPEKQAKLNAATIKGSVSIILAAYSFTGGCKPGFLQIQDELLRLLETGLPNVPVPTEKRLDELDVIARIGSNEIAQDENRLLASVAQAIQEHGVKGATIERIAEKMGTAKSSLYFYFPTKGKMLKELLLSVTRSILDLCIDRAARGRTFAEQLYLCMAVQEQFLMTHPEVMSVFSWIRYETLRKNPDEMHENLNTDKLVECFKIEGLFGTGPTVKLRFLSTMKWALILSASAVIQEQEHEDSSNHTKGNHALLRDIYKSMLNGDKEII